MIDYQRSFAQRKSPRGSCCLVWGALDGMNRTFDLLWITLLHRYSPRTWKRMQQCTPSMWLLSSLLSSNRKLRLFDNGLLMSECFDSIPKNTVFHRRILHFCVACWESLLAHRAYPLHITKYENFMTMLKQPTSDSKNPTTTAICKRSGSASFLYFFGSLFVKQTHRNDNA